MYKSSKSIYIIISLFLTALYLNAQEWELVWSDEFNYTGHPDPTKWVYDVGNSGWGNNELQNYTSNRLENARVENGNLIIEARRDFHENIEYSSARLKTAGKGDWLYGRIEVKAKVPLGQGMWPAIWMLPTDWVYGGWPESGEIDIMENYALNGITPYTSEANIHTQAYNHMIGTNKGGKIETLSNVEENYHIYAVSWFDDHMVFDVDGQQYFSFNNEGSWQTWPFDQRFHLILNIAVGGTLGTTPNPDIFPTQMIVNYVRIYRLNENVNYNLNISSDVGGTIETAPNLPSIKSGTEVTYSAIPNTGMKFDAWGGDLKGQPANTKLVIQKDMTAKAYFKDENEMVVNGQFKADNSGWTHTMIDGSTGSLKITSNEAHIEINNSGTQLWSIALSQTSDDLKLIQNKSYTFSFSARSDINRTISTGIGKNYDDYAGYFIKTENISTSNSDYSYTFTMNEATDENVRIFFDCGLNNSDVYISNVSIIEETSTKNAHYINTQFNNNKVYRTRNGLIIENPSFRYNSQIEIFSINGRLLHRIQHVGTKTGRLYLKNKMLTKKGFYLLKIIGIESSIILKMTI